MLHRRGFIVATLLLGVIFAHPLYLIFEQRTPPVASGGQWASWEYPALDLPSVLGQLNEHGHRGEEHVVHVGSEANDAVSIIIHRLRNDFGVPIVLVPGMLASSMIFLMAGRESFGYLLADAGYDVWLLNTRGSSFSYRPFDPNSSHSAEFWQANPSVTIEHDLPALFAYVRNATQRPPMSAMYAAGFSQGCMLVQAMLATDEALNDLVRLVVNVGPHLHSRGAAVNVMRLLGRLLRFVSTILPSSLSRVDQLPLFHPHSIANRLMFGADGSRCRHRPALCRLLVHVALSPLTGLLSWTAYSNYNRSNYASYWGRHVPIGTAASHLMHYDRSAAVGFARYERSWEDGAASASAFTSTSTTTTPIASADVNIINKEYDLGRVRATQIMYHCAGDQDVTGSATHNDEMAATFGEKLLLRLVLGDGCTHLGFVFDVRGHDYRKIIDKMQQFDISSGVL